MLTRSVYLPKQGTLADTSIHILTSLVCMEKYTGWENDNICNAKHS